MEPKPVNSEKKSGVHIEFLCDAYPIKSSRLMLLDPSLSYSVLINFIVMLYSRMKFWPTANYRMSSSFV